ncbi:ABC transporter permease [Halalkalibacillus sediminis]|nr:ABC transporter permease [Halalkalibacillus sediminis]
MDTNALWKDRLSSHVKMTSRYLRLMFNDHLAFALIFFAAGFAYFYQQWLETVPNDFPVAWLMALILGLLLTYSPVRTFFKEADMVFLLSVENRLSPYIKKSFIYSFVMQSYWIAIFLFGFTPLYLTIYQGVSSSYLLWLFVILLIVKLGNMIAMWFIQKSRDPRLHYLDYGIRFVINLMIVFFLINQGILFAIIAAALLVGVGFLNYMNIHQKFSLPWDLLIEKEEARLQFFYRMANMSTDVPNLKRKPKKRHMLVRWITKLFDYKKDNTFLYLYSITFIRSRDYFGMYIRLVALAIFFIFWVPLFAGKVIFAMLLLFVTGFQFIPIYQHYRSLDWIQLYPVNIDVRRKAVHILIISLMVIMVSVLVVTFFIVTGWSEALMFAGLAVAFTVLFERFYVKNRIARLEG